jgi:hypothetical protein
MKGSQSLRNISRFDHDPANDVMIGRLKNIAKGEMPLSK